MNKDLDEKSKEEIDKRVKIMMSRFLDEPVYSKNKYVESFCLFFSRSYYKFISCFFKIKYFLQRLVKGYDDLDKWNAAWYIARKAIPVLEEMRNNFVGTSLRWHREDRFGNIIELSHDEVFSQVEPEAFSESEWRAIIEDIIFVFQYTIDMDDLNGDVVDEETHKKRHSRYKRGLKLFSIYYGSLWD